MIMEVWVRSKSTNGNLSDAVTGGISPTTKLLQTICWQSFFQCKKQMPNRMKENTTHIHSILQEDKHNSLTVLMPMVTSLTVTITAINRHTEANELPYR